MADLFLAVGLRRGMSEAVVEVHRTDARELSDLACEIASRVSGLDSLAFYWLASESVTRFDLEALDAMREERFERETFARLKAKFEPAAVVGVPGPVTVGSAEVKPVVVVPPVVDDSDVDIAVDDVGIPFFEDRIAVPVESFYVVPAGKTAAEITGKVNADPVSPFAAYIVNDVVRLRQKERRIVGPPVAEEPSTDAVAFLATMARGRRAALSEASCLAAARELYHKLGGYSTARAAEAVADRAALLEAGIPSASIVGGP